jgi:MFS family permease
VKSYERKQRHGNRVEVILTDEDGERRFRNAFITSRLVTGWNVEGVVWAGRTRCTRPTMDACFLSSVQSARIVFCALKGKANCGPPGGVLTIGLPGAYGGVRFMDIVPHLGGVRAALIARVFRRNVVFMTLFEFTWGLGNPFAMYLTFVPAYLTALGAPKAVIGAAMALWTILTPMQLLGGHFFSGRKRLRVAMVAFMASASVRLLHDLAAVFAPGIWTPPSAVAAFFAACTWYVGVIVFGQTIYVGVVTDNVPQRQRGMAYGLRSAGLGLGAVASAAVASRLLGSLPSPLNYRWSLLIGDGIFLVSCLTLLFVRDAGWRPSGPRETGFVRALATKARALGADPNYRVFLFFHLLNAMASSLGAFIVPFAKERLGVDDARIALLTVVLLGVNAVFASGIGRLADRFGYRMVGAAHSLLLVASFLVAATARSFASVCVAYGLQAMVSFSLLFVLVNMSVELFPAMGATVLAGLGNTILLPFLALVSPLAGLVVDLSQSYLTVFLIGAAVALVAGGGFVALVREPRSGRLYTVTQPPMR